VLSATEVVLQLLAVESQCHLALVAEAPTQLAATVFLRQPLEAAMVELVGPTTAAALWAVRLVGFASSPAKPLELGATTLHRCNRLPSVKIVEGVAVLSVEASILVRETLRRARQAPLHFTLARRALAAAGP